MTLVTTEGRMTWTVLVVETVARQIGSEWEGAGMSRGLRRMVTVVGSTRGAPGRLTMSPALSFSAES